MQLCDQEHDLLNNKACHAYIPRGILALALRYGLMCTAAEGTCWALRSSNASAGGSFACQAAEN